MWSFWPKICRSELVTCGFQCISSRSIINGPHCISFSNSFALKFIGQCSMPAVQCQKLGAKIQTCIGETNRYPIKWKNIYEGMTLDLEPEKLSKGFAKVNKTISQISPRPQTQCSEGEIILIQTIIMTKKRLLFSKRIQRNHPYTRTS